MHVNHENGENYVPRKFVRVRYYVFYEYNTHAFT